MSSKGSTDPDDEEILGSSNRDDVTLQARLLSDTDCSDEDTLTLSKSARVCCIRFIGTSAQQYTDLYSQTHIRIRPFYVKQSSKTKVNATRFKKKANPMSYKKKANALRRRSRRRTRDEPGKARRQELVPGRCEEHRLCSQSRSSVAM